MTGPRLSSDLQGLSDIGEGVSRGIDIYMQRQQNRQAQARQQWQDELTMRKYLDDEARTREIAAREARLDAATAAQQERENFTKGFMPSSMVPPEARASYVQRLGPNGVAENVPRYQKLSTGEYYDEARDPGVSSYSSYLQKKHEEDADVGKFGNAIHTFVGARPAREQGQYSGLEAGVRQMPNVAGAQALATSALEAPIKIETARAGAMFQPGNNITPMDKEAIIDKTLDDIAAEAKGDPNKAAQMARAQGFDSVHVQRARGRAVNWRTKNIGNVLTDSVLSTPRPKPKVPTGGTP